jgi:hypothetical protein
LSKSITAPPKVRTTAAEILYMALQTDDLVPEENEAEDILLETAWFVFLFACI